MFIWKSTNYFWLVQKRKKEKEKEKTLINCKENNNKKEIGTT
jgi:hypothetical protein